jgi:hypothetical protein
MHGFKPKPTSFPIISSIRKALGSWWQWAHNRHMFYRNHGNKTCLHYIMVWCGFTFIYLNITYLHVWVFLLWPQTTKTVSEIAVNISLHWHLAQFSGYYFLQPSYCKPCAPPSHLSVTVLQSIQGVFTIRPCSWLLLWLTRPLEQLDRPLVIWRPWGEGMAF